MFVLRGRQGGSQTQQGHTLDSLDTAFTALFTVELLINLASHPLRSFFSDGSCPYATRCSTLVESPPLRDARGDRDGGDPNDMKSNVLDIFVLPEDQSTPIPIWSEEKKWVDS
jgi:hypothetical protein